MRGEVCDQKTVAHTFAFPAEEGKTYTLEKTVYIITSRDTQENLEQATRQAMERLSGSRYAALLEDSQRVYGELFRRIDVTVDGDDEADGSIRLSNYHTLISIARNDAVHSLSAKALTGEIYNNFVWWDAEVYQLPVFTQTMPETVRGAILYRYRLLDAARENAREEGYRGARFPFTSLVTGKETVWTYVRHPFMQIHITSDVALNVVNYLRCTGRRRLFPAGRAGNPAGSGPVLGLPRLLVAGGRAV